MDSTIDISVNHALIAVFAMGLLVGFAGGAIAPLGVDQNTQGTDGADNNQPSDTQEKDYEFTDQNEPTLGSEDAEVTLYMFEDYQCPFCQKFEQNAFKDIKSNYVDTGKVRIVWKDYPLPDKIHPWADKSAYHMECVYRQDEEVFWNLKDKIFANQNSITDSNAGDQIVQWASEEGLDGEQIRECAQLDEVQQEVGNDMKEGGQLGTPTVFVGKTGESSYQKISGAQPYSIFKNAIEEKMEN